MKLCPQLYINYENVFGYWHTNTWKICIIDSVTHVWRYLRNEDILRRLVALRLCTGTLHITSLRFSSSSCGQNTSYRLGYSRIDRTSLGSNSAAEIPVNALKWATSEKNWNGSIHVKDKTCRKSGNKTVKGSEKRGSIYRFCLTHSIHTTSSLTVYHVHASRQHTIHRSLLLLHALYGAHG